MLPLFERYGRKSRITMNPKRSTKGKVNKLRVNWMRLFFYAWAPACAGRPGNPCKGNNLFDFIGFRFDLNGALKIYQPVPETNVHMKDGNTWKFTGW